ncbi:MAG: YjdF family protein [Anaerolineae bacterium]|nr:YjdF family protein [Anaerolineae bacterium]
MQLTVLFKAPYWIGVLEVERDSHLYAAAYIFGAEPSDQEVYAFVERDLPTLQDRMTVGVPVEVIEQRRVNPKRVQREAHRQVAQAGISTKAQEAMRQQLEQNKQAQVQESREQRDALRAYKRAVARAKAKAKHRGH